MVRKLQEKDKKTVLQFLEEEFSINLFIIGDIEAFGFDEDFQEVWGQFNEEGLLEGVLLRFNENFIPYWKKDDFNILAFKEIMLETDGKYMISGKESLIQNFYPHLPSHEYKVTYFCELLQSIERIVDDQDIIIAGESDCEEIYEMINEIEEFSGLGASVERYQHKLKTKTGRIYYIRNKQGDIVSVSQTTAENSKSAMIVGVCTKKGYRRKGLMTRCLSKLCHDVIKEGKSLCLFYDNLEAGKVYLRLGFQQIDNWVMVTIDPKRDLKQSIDKKKIMKSTGGEVKRIRS